MPVVVRLQRQGRKKDPNYLIVALDREAKRDGEYLERLGQYFPKAADPKDKVKMDVDAILAWKKKGAQISETVGQLLKVTSK